MIHESTVIRTRHHSSISGRVRVASPRPQRLHGCVDLVRAVLAIRRARGVQRPPPRALGGHYGSLRHMGPVGRSGRIFPIVGAVVFSTGTKSPLVCSSGTKNVDTGGPKPNELTGTAVVLFWAEGTENREFNQATFRFFFGGRFRPKGKLPEIFLVPGTGTVCAVWSSL